MISGKRIILGITGGIAAYKCAGLVRLLVKEGAEVKVIMTRAAEDFVTARTLSVLSKNEVIRDFFDPTDKWNNHVELAEWADLFLIAPLTANTLSKMATGACDSVLLATFLSARSQVIVAPAMDLEMYRHSTVKENLEALKKRGVVVIPAADGELASGLSGEGRMEEPENIVKFINDHYKKNLPLTGLKALVNAGPTYEAIDPVRFIGNRSSGKMGVALADALTEKGAEVTLVLGPSSAQCRLQPTALLRVESAEEMYNATLKHYAQSDIVICAAAVADYRPAKADDRKIKKTGESMKLDLVPTNDILKELGKLKKKQFLVGFALETNDLIENAKEKLRSKNLDMIVANAANEAGSGFGVETNRISIIDSHNKITNFELKSKALVAADIVQHIITLLHK